MGGDEAAIEVQPAGSLLTRAVLDAEFGIGRELPILPDSWLEAAQAPTVRRSTGHSE